MLGTPRHNEIMERRNHTLLGMVQCILVNSSLDLVMDISLRRSKRALRLAILDDCIVYL